MIRWEELRKILDKQLEQLILQEREKLKKVGTYPLVADDIWKHNTIPNYQNAIQTISAIRSQFLQGTVPDFAEKLAEDILQSANIKLDKNSDQFTQFCEATVRMYLEFTQQRILLNDEARSYQVALPSSIPSYPSSAPTDGQSGGQLISHVIETYCKEMVAGGNWTLKTESEFRAVYKLLIDIIYDSPIELVDYSSAQFFKETLQKLPSNMNKKPLYRVKSVKDVAAMQIPKDDLLSISKVNAYLMRVSQFFKWAVMNGYAQKNPFFGMKLKVKVADHEKRAVFDNSDLAALFTSIDYQTGKHKHPYYFWLPLLGLFTGARIEELCQLYLEDIYQKEGLWVIDINDNEDKKIKNQSSARVIPMHSRLIDLGLIDYIAILRKKGEVRLFPELKKGRDGYSQAASKWFARYSNSCGVTNSRKAFHSFRHTVINHLKQQSEVKEKIAAIAGHKDESMTTGLIAGLYW